MTGCKSCALSEMNHNVPDGSSDDGDRGPDVRLDRGERFQQLEWMLRVIFGFDEWRDVGARHSSNVREGFGMRDVRWLDRFFYAWRPGPWFASLEQLPTEGYPYLRQAGPEKMRWRSGPWVGIGNTGSLPQQGWKVHISSDLHTSQEVADICVNYLLQRDIPFKVMISPAAYAFMGAKSASRASSGKLITIYPASVHQFREVCEDLAAGLEGFAGPRILSDHPYKNSSTVYFRYGQISRREQLDVYGRKVPVIHSPYGDVPDTQAPGAYRPGWVQWPFTTWEEPTQKEHTRAMFDGRFQVVSAIQFSNSGGVYLCYRQVFEPASDTEGSPSAD